MSNELELIASIYVDEDGARTILDGLMRMDRAGTISIADAAMVTKDSNGKLHIREAKDLTAGKAAGRGALVGGALGLFFPPSIIATTLVGGFVGSVWGKLRDTGIKTGEMKDLASGLEPGNAAVLALAEPRHLDSIIHTMNAYPSKLLRHAFSAEETSLMEDAMANDDANASDR